MARSRPRIPEIPASVHVPVQGTAASVLRGGMGRGVYETIRTAILDCTLAPGMALSEQSLSDELQVSRAPVRDAFRQLVAEGLLEAVPQRGTFVSRLNRAKIADAVFVRESIECRAAALAAAAPAAQRRGLAGIVRRQSGAARRGDYTSHLSADEEFHRAILELAGRPHAWPALRLARTGMNRVRHLAIPTVGSPRLAIDQHRAIVQAIEAGQPQAAAEAMQLHIRSPLEFLDAIQAAYPHYFE